MIWVAAMAPSGTPGEVVDTLGEAVLSALRMPDVKKSFDNVGLELTPGDGNHLGGYLKRELAKFGKAVNAAGIRLD